MNVPDSPVMRPHVIQIAWQSDWKNQAMGDTPLTRGARISMIPCRMMAKTCGTMIASPQAVEPMTASSPSRSAPNAGPHHSCQTCLYAPLRCRKYRTVLVTHRLHAFGQIMLISPTRMPWPSQPIAVAPLRIQVVSARPAVSRVRTTSRNWGSEIAAATSAPLSAM